MSGQQSQELICGLRDQDAYLSINKYGAAQCQAHHIIPNLAPEKLL